jgi:hypothetical protein
MTFKRWIDASAGFCLIEYIPYSLRKNHPFPLGLSKALQFAVTQEESNPEIYYPRWPSDHTAA